jgi:long-chain acyl-CoA synthetase
MTRAEIILELTRERGGPFELVPDDANDYPVRMYRNAPASLREVLVATRAYGTRPFLIYQDETLSFAVHFQRAAALAGHLSHAGVGRGDRVALGMRNYPEWSIAFWACQAIGAAVVALNAWWTTAELAFALEDSAPSALIVDGERLQRLEPLLDGMELKTIVVARAGGAGEVAGTSAFAEVAAAGPPGAPDPLPDADVGPGDLATILYTSGTTGRPKGAMATQRNHLTNLWNTRLAGAAGRILAGLPAEAGPNEPQAGTLQTFPFFHIGGLTGLLIGATSGMRLALMYKWSPAEAVELIEAHRLASVSGVPIVVRQLLEAATRSGRPLDSLLGVTSGGAPVPPDLIRRIGSQFAGRAMPGNGYGLTETTSAVIVNTGPDYLAHPDSVGRPVATADIRIVDETGADAPDGVIGELWVRGPNVIPGYWRNPAATEAAFGGGWFRTGDLGRRDHDGLHYVVDRIKDVIIRGGENVYCAEVEAVILEHPSVLDAAVVGLPHPEYGEEVVAVVQVRPDSLAEPNAAVEALLEALSNRLARFKIPSQVRLTPGELPRTATGKVLKRELRAHFDRADNSG